MTSKGQPHAVFAYGSNMHLGDLRRWHREQGLAAPLVTRVEPAILRDHALCWDYHSAARGAGAANVRAAQGQQVLGLLLHIDEVTLGNLDRKEGAPRVYERGERPVWVGGRAVRAWVYQVCAAYRRPYFVAPRRGYVRLMLEVGARHGFGEPYLDALRALETVD